MFILGSHQAYLLVFHKLVFLFPTMQAWVMPRGCGASRWHGGVGVYQGITIRIDYYGPFGPAFQSPRLVQAEESSAEDSEEDPQDGSSLPSSSAEAAAAAAAATALAELLSSLISGSAKD